MPNVVSLASEYAPKRLQATLVTLIFVGMGGGAVVAGIVGKAMIPIWGWRSVFYVGGALPIALALVLIKALPESVRFLIARDGAPEHVAAIMKRIAPDVAAGGFRREPVQRQAQGARREVPVHGGTRSRHGAAAGSRSS
jgi:AAHS family 4-hydroxybenzoate transporter-like MFS transporter